MPDEKSEKKGLGLDSFLSLMLRVQRDAQIVIDVIKRRPVDVLASSSASRQMAISPITWVELMHGAEKSSQVGTNRIMRAMPAQMGKTGANGSTGQRVQ